MNRVPEPELMTEVHQAKAYAEADFESAHSSLMAQFRERFPTLASTGTAVDLGCGPGDISCRFAAAYPGWRVHGVDASEAMMAHGPTIMARYPGVAQRVELLVGLLPDCTLPLQQYQAVLSNSLLHHLSDPLVLWRTVTRLAGPGAAVLVMDLVRPETPDLVDELVLSYAGEEPSVLRRDFANSLRAAYRLDEIERQLVVAQVEWLSVKQITDRHVLVWGTAT